MTARRARFSTQVDPDLQDRVRAAVRGVTAATGADYTLTQLGIVATGTNSETGPPADKVTVHVTAGKQVDGKLTDRTPANTSTSTEPAPGN